MEDVNERRRISFSLSKVECAPQEINSREIRLHLPFSATWNKREFILKVTFSLSLPLSMLKLPTDHLQRACPSNLSISGELSEPRGAEDFFPRFSLSRLLSRVALA